MTPEEKSVLLLCSTLGQPRCVPLSVGQLFDLRLRVSNLSSFPDGELTPAFLQEMGYSIDMAERIVTLLDREEQMTRYLAAAAAEGIRCVTFFSEEYPHPMIQKLAEQLPPVLYCAGELELLHTRCAGLVGSRQLGPTGQAFASRVGIRCAEEGVTLCSGGAVGADTVGTESCRRAGGSIISFLADSLEARVRRGVRRGELLVSESGFRCAFSAARAYSRNRLIHLMGQRTFVAQTAYRSGGTWQGSNANLRAHWSELMVCNDGTRGAAALIADGATAVSPDGPFRIYEDTIE